MEGPLLAYTTLAVYAALFATGNLLYGATTAAVVGAAILLAAGGALLALVRSGRT